MKDEMTGQRLVSHNYYDDISPKCNHTCGNKNREDKKGNVNHENYGLIVLDNFLVQHSSVDKTLLSRMLRSQFTMSTRQEYASPPRSQMQLPTQTVLSRARAQPAASVMCTAT
ncbi:uncharacterized protein [Anoplolepis gracilipes]|uniref:uncharacterized protein n=1 Tax=Anoplolepis gracilipes TaxID=354296 RepID=UPI003BA17F5F